MKHFLLFIACVIVTTSIAQTLHPNSLNLNAGGVIHDVAYDDYYDAYIVVGDFSTINGQSRNNLAFIDAQTLSVLSHNPITGINGIIRSVEVVNFVPHYNINIGTGHRNYIYLGGNFTTINTNNKVSMARLRATHYYAQPPVGGLANYNLQTAWDAQIWWDNFGAEYGVHDFHVMGDTLIAVGEFNNLNATYLTGDFNRKVIALDADSPNFLSKNMTFLNGIAPFVASATEPIQGIRQLGNRLFLYGEDNNLELINEYQLNGTYVQQIEYCNPNSYTVLDFEPHTTSTDTMLFAYEGAFYGAGAYFITSYQSDGSLWNCPGVSTSNTMLDFPTMGAVNYLEVYDDFIMTASSNTNKLYVSKRNGTATVPFLNSFNLNAGWFNSYPSLVKAPCLKSSNNLLFFSTNSLSSVDGSTRNGLAVFCLEPNPAEPFTASDPMACEGDSSIYTIPQAQCADGYRWTYSGSGALYRIAGTNDPWTALTSVELLGTNTNSIEVLFPLGATSGTLSVEPFTVFSTTDNRYSQGQTIAVTVNQKPDIILAPSHSLNCYSDSTVLVAQTSNPNPVFEWAFNGSTLTNDTLLITINDTILLDSVYYHMTITDAVTGCFNTDSTYFTQDLIAQPIDQSAITTNPAQFTCLTDSMAIHSNIVGANVYWTSPSQAGTFPDAYWINDTTIPSGDLTVYATYISNGCSAQADFGGIVENTVQADGTILGYNYQGGGTSLDTLDCWNDSITINCAVTAQFANYSTAEWLDQGVPTGSDQLTITQADANGANYAIYSFRTFNDSSGCTRDYDVQITFDFDTPFVPQLPDQTLNCSEDSIILVHPMNGNAQYVEGWIVGVQQTNSDTLIVDASGTGEYYYQVMSGNGCTNQDTVLVIQTLDLLLNMPSDTLICPEQIVTISPSVIGNSETPSFMWSTGSTNSSEMATGGINSELIVTVSTPSGCTGTDTTLILITAPIDATITPFAGCTDGSLEITSISGGAGNYQYSLDQSTWQSTTNFSGIAFGNYTVYVEDNLGCVYEFDQALDGTASTIEMLYVASTYNEQGDTIVLVNITDFTGFDSVEWIIPTSANLIFESDSVAIISMSVDGWYDVGLVGYIGSDCEYLYNAPVYFGTHAPDFDSTYAQSGIQSFVVHPNPTTGSFNVVLEFGVAQNYTILITNSLGQAVGGMGASGTGTLVDQFFTFPVGSPAGSYRVHVIADYDAQHKMIILN